MPSMRRFYNGIQLESMPTLNSFFIVIVCFIASILQSCKSEKKQHITSQFQHILDSTYTTNPKALGILVHVEAPEHNISWSGAAGHSNKESKEVLEPEVPILIASNTKTYVAAAVLKLVEEEKFSLDDSIQQLIQAPTNDLLTQNGYTTGQITVRHLLSHTSGIADYVDANYFDLVNAQPQHQWSRDEQIARAMEIADPLAAPGIEFSYADVNYLLLTEIIERQSDEPFYSAIKHLLQFEKHGLKNTWFINLEEAPQGALPLAHQYWDKYNWDSYELNPSWDLYGGGGLVATANDLAAFFQLLFEGKIITDQELLSELHNYVLPSSKSNYCLGLRNIVFHGATGYYHGGFWGTDALYFPVFNASLSACTLQKDERSLNERLHADMMNVLLNERLKGLFPVQRKHKDSTVKVNRNELSLLYQKGIRIASVKTADTMSDYEHTLLIMLMNTGSLYLPENDSELNKLYVLFSENIDKMNYRHEVGNVLEWIPNRGMGMYFPDLDLDFGGAKTFGWGFFEVMQ